MLTEKQEKYLSKHLDGETVVVKPFNPKAQEVAKKIIDDLQKALPDLEIHFGGGVALGLSGKNDIDLNILSAPEEYNQYSPVIEKLFGEPNLKGSSTRWKFMRDGFEIDLHLTDKNSTALQEQIKVFEILSQNQELRKEYEQIKLPYGPIDYKEYMIKKYEFFNKILKSE
jgi:GrpB-like predicted nucleotidyltransferase (UPF0157 family)